MTSEPPILTIAIPTYNRNAILRDNLVHLLPQLTDRCRVLIVDNHSDIPVAEAIKSTVDSLCPRMLQVVRNSANIGGNGNIVRCFELCQTDWLWVLGDDDRVEQDAIDTVLQGIDRWPDASLLNFCSDAFSRKHESGGFGLAGLLDALDDTGNLLFISVNVYRAIRLKEYLLVGYQYCYSFAPHLAMLFSSLRSDHAVHLLPRKLVHVRSHGDQEPLDVTRKQLGFMTMLELDISMESRHKMASKLRMELPRIETVLRQCLRISVKTGDCLWGTYVYDQTCSRMYGLDGDLWARIRIMLLRMLFHAPRSGLYLLDFTYRVRTKWKPK